MATDLRLLILGSEATNVERLAHLMRESGLAPAWTLVTSEWEYRDLLDTEPDVVLADYSYSPVSVGRAIQVLRERNLDVPLVVVNGPPEDQPAIECIREGAAEYLSTERLELLADSTRRALERSRVDGRDHRPRTAIHRPYGDPETSSRELSDELARTQALLGREVAAREGAEEALRKSEQYALELAQNNAATTELASIISTSTSVEEIYRRFGAQVGSFFPSTQIVIARLDLDRQTMIKEYTAADYAQGWSDLLVQLGLNAAKGAGSSGDILRPRKATIVSPGDIEAYAKEVSNQGLRSEPRIRSVMAIPLLADEDSIGILFLCSTSPNAYTERDVRLMESVTPLIVRVVGPPRVQGQSPLTTQALEKTQQSLEQLTREYGVMSELAHIVGSLSRLEDIYPRYAERVRGLVSYDRLVIATVSPERDTLTYDYVGGVEIVGWGEGVSWSYSSATLGSRLIRDVLGNRAGLVTSPGASEGFEAEPPEWALAGASGIRSIMVFPLLYGEGVAAVLTLSALTSNAFSDEDLELLERVSAPISGAIFSTKLQDRLRREADEARQLALEYQAIAELGQVITSFLNLGETDEAISEDVQRLTPIDRITITSLDQDHQPIREVYSTWVNARMLPGRHVRPVAASLVDGAFNGPTGLLLHVDDVDDVARRFPSLVPDLRAGVRSAIAVPLHAKAKMKGLLYIATTKHHAYTAQSLTLAKRAGDQVAGAVLRDGPPIETPEVKLSGSGQDVLTPTGDVSATTEKLPPGPTRRDADAQQDSGDVPTPIGDVSAATEELPHEPAGGVEEAERMPTDVSVVSDSRSVPPMPKSGYADLSTSRRLGIAISRVGEIFARSREKRGDKQQRTRSDSGQIIQLVLWVAAVLFYGFGDTVTSLLVFQAGGAEGNVLLGLVLNLIGPTVWAFLLIKVATTIGAMIIARIWRPLERLVSVAMLLLGMYLVTQNLFVLFPF